MTDDVPDDLLELAARAVLAAADAVERAFTGTLEAQQTLHNANMAFGRAKLAYIKAAVRR